MTIQPNDGGPPAKRQKTANSSNDTPNTNSLDKGLAKPISPPLPKRKNDPSTHALLEPSWSFHDVPKQTAAPAQPANQKDQSSTVNKDGQETQYMASPIQLTKITDLAPAENIDVVSLKDILGDPMIRECWNFNYLFDLPFVM
jgi:tyrosyl-DNA phosphodiesterase-1